MLLMSILFSMSLSACGSDDDDEPNDTRYYDFSIVWDVIDKGDYTTAQAQSIASDFTTTSEDIFQACTEAYAIREFNEFCEQLRYEFATGYKRITLKARLVRNEGNVTIATKTFKMDPNGTTVNSANGVEVVTVVIE